MIFLGRGGIINAERVVMVAAARSEPVKRLLASTPEERILNLTYGYPRESVILFENGYLAVISQTVEALAEVLESEPANQHESQPWPPDPLHGRLD